MDPKLCRSSLTWAVRPAWDFSARTARTCSIVKTSLLSSEDSGEESAATASSFFFVLELDFDFEALCAFSGFGADACASSGFGLSACASSARSAVGAISFKIEAITVRLRDNSSISGAKFCVDEIVCMVYFLPVGVVKFHFQTEFLGLLDGLDHALGQFTAEDPDLRTILHEVHSPAFPCIVSVPAIIRIYPGEVDMRTDGKPSMDIGHSAVPDGLLNVVLGVSPIRGADEYFVHGFTSFLG